MTHETMCRLLQAMDQEAYATAYAILRPEEELLTDLQAEQCLERGLRASPGLFRRILQLCQPREYSARIHVDLEDGDRVFVNGTMLTLAAALDRPEHVKILLEAGYDPNSAGIESAAAFERPHFFVMDGAAPYGDRCAFSGSFVGCSGRHRWNIRFATPLSAAVACGSVRAVSALMKCPEVWKVESGVVCRAAVAALMTFDGKPKQAVAWQVFGRRSKTFNAERLLTSCDLQMEYAADICPLEMLRCQIESGFCDEAGARNILKLLGENRTSCSRTIRSHIRKLELMERHYLDLCRESRVTGIILREVVRRYTPEHPRRRLMEQWKRLSGEEGDLTWANVELWLKPKEHLSALLQELEQGMELVMDADAFIGVDRADKKEKATLLELLRHIRLRHNRGLDGISALSATLLSMGDLRFLRKAAKLGAFAGEDPKELLEYLRAHDLNNLRALVLAFGQPVEEGTPRWMTESRGNFWNRRWEIPVQTYELLLCQMSGEELPREECLRRLQMMDHPAFMEPFWYGRRRIDCELADQPRKKTLHTCRPEPAIFCGTQKQPLELMMTYMPEKLDQLYEINFGNHRLMELEGTPLAMAAASGRTELVKLLLDSGFHPDEQGRGVVSVLKHFSMDMPVTPVMAAIYYGEEETAKLLLEAGAACDFSKPAFRELLKRGDEETRALAARLPNVNYESISQEWLEELERKTLFF